MRIIYIHSFANTVDIAEEDIQFFSVPFDGGGLVFDRLVDG